MPIRIPAHEKRTLAQLREHYEIEKELATRLLHAKREERQHLYTALYDELYHRVPHHPQLTRKTDVKAQRQAVSGQMRVLKNFLKPESVFMEIGPGDCSLSLEVSKFAKRVYAVDVSEEITKNLKIPSNFSLILSDGCGVPIPEELVDVAYSNSLLEHLHPEDAWQQLRDIYNSLTPHGVYICVTPNRLSGPHDISKYFDDAAKGLHLQEYIVAELARLFKAAGFAKVQTYLSIKGLAALMPIFPAKYIESFLKLLPFGVQRQIASSFPIRSLLGITLVATKGLKKE